jgi:hypothetical protein
MIHRRLLLPVLLAVGSAAAAPRRAAAQDASTGGLAVWVGRWHVEAESRATAFSKPGTTSAELSCAWTDSHQFVVCESRIASGRDTTTQLTVYGAADSGFVSTTIVPGGTPPHRSRITVDGDRWTYENPDGASTSTRWRTVNEFVSPTEMHWVAQYANTGGAWVTTMTGVDRKIAP